MHREVERNGYRINMEKLFEFVFKNSDIERREQEITDGFEVSEGGEAIQQVSKVIREVKSRGDNYQENMRYDLLKTLIVAILESENDEENDFGLKVVVNTLSKYGILEDE